MPGFDVNVALANFKARNKNIRFISGKWFISDKEVSQKKIQQIFWKDGGCHNSSQLDELTKLFLLFEEDTEGDWPEMPIVSEAKHYYSMFKAKGKPLPPLPYPLTQKQLKVINYLLFKRDEEILIIACGVGGSGKSTFGNIICQLFENDVAHLNLADLGDDYKLATGIDKRLIYSDELNSDDLNNGTLKTLISNQSVTVNGKFQIPYTAKWQSSMFFSCNKPPRLSLDDTGMMRRILYLYMNTKIANPDTSLQKKRFTHDDLLIFLYHALDQDMTNWKGEFWNDTRDLLVKDNSVYILRQFDNYADYASGCRDRNLRPFSEPKWRDIKEMMMSWGYQFGSGAVDSMVNDLERQIRVLKAHQSLERRGDQFE